MERRLKERLIGASVLVMLAVILIPMILDDTATTETRITESNIPQRPEQGFASEIVPLPDREPPVRQGEEAPAPGQPVAREAPANAVLPAARVPERTVAGSDTPRTETPILEAPAKPTTGPVPVPERVGLSAWVVQLGSFSSEENAKALGQKLRDAGYAAFVEPVGEGSRRAYRVRVGPELLKSDAQALADRLRASLELEGIVLAYP
jgi:DedD protein